MPLPPSEARLRDYLAGHLDLIESGLTLVDTEFEVPNILGARGFIDIFAWDNVRNLVIIELKVSVGTSRTALHEVHKYVALLRATHGIPAHKLRCIVLSTDWHELRVPFSDFARTAVYPVEGRVMHVDDQNIPTRIEPFVLVPEAVALQTCPHAFMLFYEDKEDALRNQSAEAITLRAEQLGIQDYCLLLLDKPRNFGKAATFAIYVAVGRLSAHAAMFVEQHTDSIFNELHADSDGLEWCHEQAAIDLMTKWIDRAQFEIGYPDKLGNILHTEGWSLSSIRRGGRYDNSIVLPDELLLQQLIGLEGDSAQWYFCQTSPRFEASWQNAKASAKGCLTGNASWTAAFEWFMARAEREANASSVSAYVFNPLNIAMLLWRFPLEGRTAAIPGLDLAREATTGIPLVWLLGSIEWDGVTYPQDPEDILRKAFEEVFDIEYSIDVFFITIVTKSAWQLDAPLMAAHGLRYFFTELEFQSERGTTPIIRRLGVTNGAVCSHDGTAKSFIAFVEENRPYLAALDELFSAHSSVVST
jgi:hypothetical protein